MRRGKEKRTKGGNERAEHTTARSATRVSKGDSRIEGQSGRFQNKGGLQHLCPPPREHLILPLLPISFRPSVFLYLPLSLSLRLSRSSSPSPQTYTYIHRYTHACTQYTNTINMYARVHASSLLLSLSLSRSLSFC